MKAVLIDFSGARPATPAWALALFAVGAAICIAAVWRMSAITMREARTAADIERARVVLAAGRPSALPQARLPEARAKAINDAIVQLNLPWQALFQSLEKVKPANVALLGLEPNGERHTLRILAETKQPEDMLDFVRLLRAQPQFTYAVLTRHEVNLQDPNRPLRFTVEAVWEPAL